MALKNVQVGNTYTGVLDGTQGAAVAITVMFITNIGPSAANLTLHAIDYSDTLTTPGDKNIILKEVSIEPGDTFTLDTEKLVLGYDPVSGDADKVIAISNENNFLSLTMSYVEL